jgi:putative FmdB family regulatory protein
MQMGGRTIIKEESVPIYEYKCAKCSECFEIRQSFSDKNSVVCHKCGAEAKRIFVPVPIVFKGPGFYVTDCAAEKEKAVTKSDVAKLAENSPKAEVKAEPAKAADKNN